VGYFQHERALCESTQIGDRTRIWAFAHVLPGARIGTDCNICDGVFVENDVVVGDRVTVKCGVQLWDGVRLADDVFVGPNATFSNDIFPRSRRYLDSPLTTIVGPGASIGANATILPGISIGRGAMIGAGAVVTQDVPANAVVVGNPARITGYVGPSGLREPPPAPEVSVGSTAARELAVPGVRLVELTRAVDLRGALVAMEFDGQLPFSPRRCFAVFDVPSKHVRGAHAHRTCEQLLVCLRGSLTALVDDGTRRAQIVLDRPDLGLYVPPMIWGSQFRYSPDAVLLVLASREYEDADYIREYEQFLHAVGVEQ
jgi:acetyltransferase-like isoleucine patch superfamily enzyme